MTERQRQLDIFDNHRAADFPILRLGDCLENLKKIESGSIDVVLTDPPFSSGTRREAAKGLRRSMTRGRAGGDEWFGSDSLTVDGFSYLMRACAVEWYRILKKGGHILCFIDWRMLPHLSAAIEAADLRKIGLIVWDKTYFGMGNYFRNQHELILHFSKDKGAPPLRRDIGNVIQVKPIRKGSHPTEKPVDLLKTMLSVVCPPGGVVIDPFMGSGATGEACNKLDLGFIGIEREKEYYLIARKRLKHEK